VCSTDTRSPGAELTGLRELDAVLGEQLQRRAPEDTHAGHHGQHGLAVHLDTRVEGLKLGHRMP
jgi:hypothetical protein